MLAVTDERNVSGNILANLGGIHVYVNNFSGLGKEFRRTDSSVAHSCPYKYHCITL